MNIRLQQGKVTLTKLGHFLLKFLNFQIVSTERTSLPVILLVDGDQCCQRLVMRLIGGSVLQLSRKDVAIILAVWLLAIVEIILLNQSLPFELPLLPHQLF